MTSRPRQRPDTTRATATWALADQVASSGTNFLLPIVGLRRFSSIEADRLSIALTMVFVAELYSANEGIGYMIVRAGSD